jgi:hypothetical protein
MVGWVIAKLNGGIDGIISKKWGTYTRLHHSTNHRDVMGYFMGEPTRAPIFQTNPYLKILRCK